MAFNFGNSFNKPKGPVVNNPQHRNNNFGGNNNNATFAPQGNGYNNNNNYNKNYNNNHQSAPVPPQSAPSYGVTPYGNGNVNVLQKKSLPPTEFQQSPASQNAGKNKFKLLVSLLFSVFVIGAIFIAFSVSGGGGDGEEEEAENREIQPFPLESRVRSNDFVGIIFTVPPPDNAAQAFLDAASRWSKILAGSEGLMLGASRTVACGLNIGLVEEDHIRIFSSIELGDGPGGVLGSAGPCAIQRTGIPTFGRMEFDSADLDSLDARGQLESVILHEMGHVLGIGTLWNNFGFIIGAVANANNPSTNENPFYDGPLGVAAFRSLNGIGGNEALLIENGFTNGVRNGAGQGSVNGHFAKTSLNVELMTFAIQGLPPLSIVTIRALQDFGYSVDIGQADFFDPSANFVLGDDNIQEPIYLQGDVLPVTDDMFDYEL